MTIVNSTTTTTTADPVRAAELAFAAANLAKTNADAALAAARAVTDSAKGRIAKPGVTDDPRDLILALHNANANEALADLTREITENQIIAAHVALKAAINESLTPQFNEIVAARIAACEAADAAREALAVAQHEFDTQTQKLYALRGAGKSGIPNIAEIAGTVTVPQRHGREVHCAETEREIWAGVVA